MSQATPVRENNVFSGLQALRAYAAVSVMIGHAVKEWCSTYGLAEPFDVQPLLYGVDIFFVISGFIMFVISGFIMYRTSSQLFGARGGVQTFVLKRLLRIVPLYWLFTTLMVITLFAFGDQVRSTEFDPWNVVSSYLFIPSERPGGRIAPVLSLGWTLNYEMFFYAIFAAALVFPRRLGATLIVVTIVGLVAYGVVFQPTWTPVRFWTNSITLEFAAGLLLAIFLQKRTFAAVSLALIVAGALLLHSQMFGLSDGQARVIGGGLPAVLLVAGAAILPHALDLRIPSWLTLLGDSSYALYLGHRFVLRAATMGLAGLPLANAAGLLVYCTIVTTVAVVASVAIYQWLERPVLARGRRLLLDPRPAAAAFPER